MPYGLRPCEPSVLAVPLQNTETKKSAGLSQERAITALHRGGNYENRNRECDTSSSARWLGSASRRYHQPPPRLRFVRWRFELECRRVRLRWRGRDTERWLDCCDQQQLERWRLDRCWRQRAGRRFCDCSRRYCERRFCSDGWNDQQWRRRWEWRLGWGSWNDQQWRRNRDRWRTHIWRRDHIRRRDQRNGG
jgi:hypothetical protein